MAKFQLNEANVNMIQNVQIIMLALTTNAWILVVFQNPVESRRFVKQLHIDQFVVALKIGQAIPMKSVINVGFLLPIFQFYHFNVGKLL